MSNVPTGDVQLNFRGTGLDATLTVRGVQTGDQIDITVRLTDNSIDRVPSTRVAMIRCFTSGFHRCATGSPARCKIASAPSNASTGGGPPSASHSENVTPASFSAGARLPDKFESQPVEFFRRVAAGYAARAAADAPRFVRIDASQTRDQVWQQIETALVARGALALAGGAAP